MTRRNFIRNAVGLLIAAPMVVKAESLMRVAAPKVVGISDLELVKRITHEYLEEIRYVKSIPPELRLVYTVFVDGEAFEDLVPNQVLIFRDDWVGKDVTIRAEYTHATTDQWWKRLR